MKKIMHHDQVGAILGIEGWFYVEPINTTQHTNRIEDKGKMSLQVMEKKPLTKFNTL
jgi:hypothetical protein